ncbi:DUF6266 family protein [Pedobacter insulae]|uniref:Uncharacterized protein n=1 Tax=Pedobacter insulae TaxID=414048 RepID=A0A1I3AAG6_9SPHI|nr:DUF6266 family protein [Pedobacter insulae]SFH47064.1 hypothetical protein SAMN04489864_113126 [Pedobacter insulae]
MAILINGIISGKLKGMVYFNCNGKQGVRTLPKKSTTPPTEAQQAQQMRFGITTSFFAALKSLIRAGYGTKLGVRSTSNLCISYHVKNAITGIFPDLAIDYAKVVLTKGILSRAHDAIAFADRGAVNFAWKNWNLCANPNDEAILVVYNPAKCKHVWLRTSVKRASEAALLPVPLSFCGDKLHCWIAFISANGKQFSNSVYLETVRA